MPDKAFCFLSFEKRDEVHIYGYARVSTVEQNEQRQTAALQKTKNPDFKHLYRQAIRQRFQQT